MLILGFERIYNTVRADTLVQKRTESKKKIPP